MTWRLAGWVLIGIALGVGTMFMAAGIGVFIMRSGGSMSEVVLGVAAVIVCVTAAVSLAYAVGKHEGERRKHGAGQV